TYPNPSQEVLDYTRGTYVVSFGELQQDETESLVNALESLEGMVYVEPNRVIHIEPTEHEDAQIFNMPDTFPWPFTPNDPMFNQQWNMEITKANWAWNVSTGEGVKIGFIDTGIDPDHEDLEPNIDFEHSYNFRADNTNINDTYNHGTLVSGIAAAKIDNALGVAGFAGNADICVFKGDVNGGIYPSAAAEALYYASDSSILIINMSFGDYGASETEKNAVNYAWDAGCFICAGAGNDNKNASNFYPAAYEHVMAVGGINSQDERWVKDASMGSNYGSSVHVFAPSVGVPTTNNDGAYATGAYGTSMSTPHVAGLAALIWEEYPTWTNQQVWDKIIESADTITIDKGKVLRINAMKALDIDSVGIAEQPTQTRGLYPLSLSTIGREITLSYSVPSSTPYTLSVYDVSGREVHNTSGNLSGAGQITCTPELTQGVYFWQVETEAGEETGKFVFVR
ncbi:S8 family serine peptidase, partial [candidate division WOR-3 bacterium]|nr:S8 family serine peptidase [candidate division WOR-3 bacterium]